MKRDWEQSVSHPVSGYLLEVKSSGCSPLPVLQFTALLRLPDSLRSEEKRRRCEAVAQSLHLAANMDTSTSQHALLFRLSWLFQNIKICGINSRVSNSKRKLTTDE